MFYLAGWCSLDLRNRGFSWDGSHPAGHTFRSRVGHALWTTTTPGDPPFFSDPFDLLPVSRPGEHPALMARTWADFSRHYRAKVMGLATVGSRVGGQPSTNFGRQLGALLDMPPSVS
jgi:hypothetical protein